MTDDLILPVLIGGTVLLVFFAVWVTIFFILNRERHQLLIAKQRRLELDYQNQLLKTRLEVQETTLNQVSQELHDDIGQTMTVAQTQLIDLMTHVPSNVLAKVERLERTVNKAMEDIRSVSHMLNTEYIHGQGLRAGIEQQLRLTSVKGLDFSIDVDEDMDLKPEVEITVFRVVQEAINNIVKHSKANMATIHASTIDDLLIVEINDNGVGINREIIESKAIGIGLVNMRQRIQSLKGTLEIDSNKNGSSIVIKIPI